MNSTGSLHLTQSKHGIWYYQRWMPTRFRAKNPTLQKVFRISLRTKNKKKASTLSRSISVKIDKLALQYFDNPEEFGKAMKLLSQSAKADQESNNFQEYEERFLFLMDDYDEWLLSKAQKFDTTIANEFKKLANEIHFLKKALLNTDAHKSAKSHEKLISDLKEAISPTLPDSKNPTLETLYNSWKDANKHEHNKIRSFSKSIEFFIRVVNDFNGSSIRIQELDADHIHHYQSTYKKIPVRTKNSDHTISSLIKLDGEKKSPKTIRDNFAIIRIFLSWIQAKAYPIQSNLLVVLSKGSDIKVRDKSKKKRVDLSDEDLARLFNSEKYVSTANFRTSAMYWAPLIALFTGARMSEILQLETHDIEQIQDIWVFNFDGSDHNSEDKHKRLKNDSSTRLVPVHHQLIKLDFIQYVNSRTSRLFDDEPRDKHGKFDAFSKRQRTYRKQVGVTPSHSMELKDFHSFRHTVETRLNEIRSVGRPSQRFDIGTIDGILGHASRERSIGQRDYNHSQYIEAKRNALNRLQYDSIVFENILHWKKCNFSRLPYRQKMTKSLRANGQ